MKLIVFCGLIFSISLSYASSPQPPSQKQKIRIMSYNVENLFDTSHDEGKQDFEFLPKENSEKINYCQKLPENQKAPCLAKDWTESRLEIKLNQIRKVYDLIPDQKPDLIGLIEVENDAVVGKLAQKLGYQKWVTTNSPDERGIDVALMYNENSGIRFVGSKFHPLDSKLTGKPTRDILEVNFSIPNSNYQLAVFVNHWPSQAGPTSTRIAAGEALSKITKERIAKGYHVFVMGDFNVVDLTDQPSPFLPLMSSDLIDVNLLYKKKASELKLDISTLPVGTYFYGPEGKAPYYPDMTWNSLDRFFVSSSLLEGKETRLDLKSFKILAPSEITRTYTYKNGIYKGTQITNTPWGYYHYTDNAEEAGFSDHFPIYIDLFL